MKITKQSNCSRYKSTKRRLNLRAALIYLCMFAFISTYAQIGKVTVNLKNVSVKELFNAIEKQTSYRFSYRDVEIKGIRNVSISAANSELKQLLTSELSKLNLTYTVSGNKIIVTPVAVATSAQPKKVTGKVMDANGEPVVGATIKEQGTLNGTITDLDGNFSLDVATNKMLEVSYIGYKSQTIKVILGKPLVVTLKEDTEVLEEVVIVGYGTMKKKNLTGAVVSINTKDLPQVANVSISQMLSGKAAGLSVLKQSAQPGGAISLQIRGTASNRDPLIIIDGFPQTGFSQPGGGYSSQGDIGRIETSLNSLNPNDIESIEILKDASATSIYGARAAGGVILITTKKGSSGKAQVNYKTSFSVQKLYGFPQMLNSVDFMTEANEVIKEAWMRENAVYPYGHRSYAQAVASAGKNGITSMWVPRYNEEDFKNPVNTNWVDAITRTGFTQEHNLSVQGGSEKTKYMASLNYYDQKGAIKGNDINRFSFRINLDQEFNKYLNGGVSTSISQNKYNNIPLSGAGSEKAGVIRAAQQFNPTLSIKDEEGNYTLDPMQAFSPNPVSLLDIDDESCVERIMLLGYLNLKPIKDLSLRLQVGVDRNQGKRDTYMPTTVLFGAREGGYATKSVSNKTDYNLNFIINWKKQFGHSLIDIMAGYDYEKFTWDGFDAMNSKFPYDSAKWNNLAAGSREKPGVGSFGGNSNMASYIMRLNYTFMDRYLLTANFRADGSSNFAQNNKWGIFGGVSLGWKIHEEVFMRNTKEWLSELKLRIGWGQTGNDGLTGVNTYYSTGWNYIFGNNYTNGIGLYSLGNPDLKWETQTDINIGLDFGLLNQRITGTLEYFNRRVTDILGKRDLASYMPVNQIAANLTSEKETYGFEFSLKSHNISKPNFSWVTNTTFTYYRDRWKKRDINWKPDILDNTNAYFNELWFYRTDGLVQIDDFEYIAKYGAIPGTVKVLDLNGYKRDEKGNIVVDENGKPMYSGEPDGIIDNADKVNLGVNQPFTIGFNNLFSYKNLDFGIYFYGMFNRWKINDIRMSYQTTSEYGLPNGTNAECGIKDRWSYDNMNSNIPSIFQSKSKYPVGDTDFYLEKAWFIRCSNITLGYTFDKSKIKILNSLRVFFDAQNLFTITPYSGLDPETDMIGGYPNQRTFALGVDINF